MFAKRLKKAGSKVAAIAGDLLDAETMYAAKKLLEGQGSKLLEGRQTGLTYDTQQPVARSRSTRPSPGSRAPTRCCWSARTSAGKRR